MNEPPKSLALLEAHPHLHWEDLSYYTYDADTDTYLLVNDDRYQAAIFKHRRWLAERHEESVQPKKKRKKRKLKRVVLNASEYSRLNNEDKAKYDFSWLGGEEKRVIMNALLGHTTKGIFHHELTVHAPDFDRMSRDSQHRAWSGYAWEIV